MTDSRVIDRESRRLIREELLTNLLVEAGAGSGKTQMLAERMAAGVASGDYQIEHMAAVTFTRKAASELRGRFHLALEKTLSSCDTPERAARTQAALGNLERFFAGTIHSFCARLLRERPVESGVSPGFTELDEVQDEQVRDRAWRDFIAAQRSAGNAEMLALLETGVRPRDLDSAFGIICGNEDVEFPPGDGTCPDPKPALKALQKFWENLEKLLPAKIDEDTSCNLQQRAVRFRGQLRVARKRLGRPSTVAQLLEVWDCESKITQNRWASSTADKKRFKGLIETLHGDFHASTVDPFLRQWRQYVYRLSVGLLARAREYAAAERRLRNALNYGDLLNLTAKVLRENIHVRRALQRKYKHLFVDEFQDTDPVQAEIVFLLAAAESSAADWRTVPLRSGALFVVGDPKQSIYRFRRADIEIYNIVRERFSDPATGCVVPLTMNFRSVPGLCDWANGVFIGQFPGEPTVHSPRFAALDANPQKKASGGVFTITHTCNDYRDVPEEDAAKIARYIKSEVDAGRRKYSDFLILTRKKKDRIAPYATALEQLNIPIEVSGAGAFGKSAEVETLTALLRALADPHDALALIGVLRGPLFGTSDAALFGFKQRGGWFSVFFDPDDKSHPFTAGDPSVLDALSILRQYYRWTRVLPAGAALDRVLEHAGYLALAATTPGGVEAGDLLHAIDWVRQVAEDGGSFADAAEALQADSEATNEVESLPLECGKTDVVRLMNLHKAKGLEAAVVFLADPCGGLKPRVDVHIERRGDGALGWFKVAKKSEGSYAAKLLGEHADWATHEAAEVPFLQAEENRLLYVAATRARELLVVSRQVPPKGTAAWGVLNSRLAGAKELAVPANVPVAANKPGECGCVVQSAAQAARAQVQEAVTPASWSITSVTAEAHHIAQMAPATESSADDPTKVVNQATPAHRADAGMAWGTLMHGLLEHAMRHKGTTHDDLRRLAMWLTVEEPQLRSVVDVALKTVHRVAASPFWDAAVATQHFPEVPFTVSSSTRDVLNGAIDLLHANGERWRVVDYKTDVGDPSTVRAYQRQLAMYQGALAQLGIHAEAEVMAVRATPEGRA